MESKEVHAVAEKKENTKTIAYNRIVRHEYFVDETFEAGIELTGTEVKSLRAGQVNLKDSWVDVGTGELIVKQMHISPYEHGNIFNRDPMRERRLLMHRRQINYLFGKVKTQGATLIPISLYFKGSRVKMQLGLCRGKKLYDKREDAARRDAKRDIDRAMKGAYR
ncbi:MAG: SsrA-binding protein SmpB [Clostridia bacterium]|nr:SsrA-binding protein SmpB [Clostridia bacterium]